MSMAGLGNMTASNEGICCSRACNVSLNKGVCPATILQPISQQLETKTKYDKYQQKNTIYLLFSHAMHQQNNTLLLLW